MRQCRRCERFTLADEPSWEKYCTECRAKDRGTWAMLLRARLHSLVDRIRQWR